MIPSPAKRSARRSVLLSILLIVSCYGAQAAAATPEADRVLIADRERVELPGVGRVLAAFVFTVGIGFAVVIGLRRFLPRLDAGKALRDDMRVVGHSNVHKDLRLHLVEVRGQTILLAEGKGGVAMTRLDGQQQATSQAPS